jgi:VIT1/CCC1 family predicted Fe2+/Mn2+ transporter
MRGRNPGGRSGAGGDYQRRMMEDANNSAQSALADQISQLKGMSQDILSEVEAQNELLDGMSGHMDQTGSMLGDTIGKLSGMLKSGGSSHMFVLTAFIVVVFIVIYFFAM